MRLEVPRLLAHARSFPTGRLTAVTPIVAYTEGPHLSWLPTYHLPFLNTIAIQSSLVLDFSTSSYIKTLSAHTPLVYHV